MTAYWWYTVGIVAASISVELLSRAMCIFKVIVHLRSSLDGNASFGLGKKRKGWVRKNFACCEEGRQFRLLHSVKNAEIKAELAVTRKMGH